MNQALYAHMSNKRKMKKKTKLKAKGLESSRAPAQPKQKAIPPTVSPDVNSVLL
jgi:hypothetical protein